VRILTLQTGVGVAVAALCFFVWGLATAISAIAGAGIGVIANLYMTLKVLKPAASPQGALGRLYIGQLVKVALTVILFLLAARIRGLSWPAMLLGYAGTLVVFWWVPLAAAPGPRATPRS